MMMVKKNGLDNNCGGGGGRVVEEEVDSIIVTDVERQLTREGEGFYKKSKRILCFGAFIASLGFVSTIINTLLSFLHDVLKNKDVMSTVGSMVAKQK